MNTIICGSFSPGRIAIDEGELSARLRMEHPFCDATVKNLTQQLLAFCMPRFCYARTSALPNSDGICRLDFGDVVSVSLCRALKGARSAFVTALTLGIETDRFIQTLSVRSKADAFIADALASALAESAMNELNRILSADCRLKERFSPGYGDFVLTYQRDILDFLRADKNAGIKLGTNYIMMTRKSVTAIIGIMEGNK